MTHPTDDGDPLSPDPRGAVGGGVPIGVVCPNCAGKGTTAEFVATAARGWFDPALKCHLCRGLGNISHETAQWLVIGRRHREMRVLYRGESLRDCAKRLGISASALSAMENGRADPKRISP